MTRETFEQLVLAWLAEPHRADLQAQVTAAAAAQPELAGELAQWRQSEALLHDALPALPAVDWARFAARVSSAVDDSLTARSPEDEVLDAALRDASSWQAEVDWTRVASRISAAVNVATRAAAPRRRVFTRVVAGAGALLAAAAALLFALLPRATVAPGNVQVAIGPPPTSADGIAIVKITRMETGEAQPQRLFIVDPIMAPTTSDDANGYY